MLAERNGDEFVVQFANRPTLYGKHASLKNAAETGADGLGIAGTHQGTVEIDNVTLWSVDAAPMKTWATARERLPKTEPRPVTDEKKKKNAKSKNSSN